MTGGPSIETKRLISRGHAELESFHAAHPDFDLLGFDFYSADATAELPEMGPALQARLQAQQRVLRITPYASIARKLLDSGFDSAHRIAAMPEHKFLRQHAHLFADEETARAVHRRAGAIKGATKHVYANLQGMLASHHYKALRANNVAPEVANYFENMPSYQDLFGSLNYCTCQDCASIFGPAAYFLDLMRITDDYITDPNISKASDNIPSGYRLEQRRPDLFDLPLTCAATNDLVPTLSVVNQILARNIGAAQSVTSGTATAAASASITLAAGASSQDGAYDGMWIVITAGTGLGQLRAISAYVGATKVASLAESWKVNPDTTSRICRVGRSLSDGGGGALPVQSSGQPAADRDAPLSRGAQDQSRGDLHGARRSGEQRHGPGRKLAKPHARGVGILDERCLSHHAAHAHGRRGRRPEPHRHGL